MVWRRSAIRCAHIFFAATCIAAAFSSASISESGACCCEDTRNGEKVVLRPHIFCEKRKKFRCSCYGRSDQSP